VPSDRARLYHEVMTGYVAHGVAPHYLEVAQRLGWEPERARTVLNEVSELGLPIWLHPGTDLIASFAPFSSLPTLYRLSIDGTPHAYAQCGLEALAVSWLFPGRQIRVDSLCPDCGEPLSLSMRDGEMLSLEPQTAVAHINVPVAKWRGQYPLA
jgi:hypothetical protein